MDSRVVLVSGGSKGLGLGIVKECLAAGWSVATFSRSATAAIGLLERQYPENFFYAEGDQAEEGAAKKIVDAAGDRFGHIDALVNNAAIAYDGLLATMRPSDLTHLVQVNITSTLLLTRECIRRFLILPRTRRKSIVNISSVVSVSGYRGLAAYGATKSAMLGLTLSLARELGPANVTVNAILPGYLDTDMSQSLSETQRKSIVRRTALGRLGSTEDITPAVRFLLSDEASFITGQNFIIDGGASC